MINEPLKKTTAQMKMERIISDILDELSRAKQIHPNYPDDIVHRAAIIAEEAGEVVQAALSSAQGEARHSDNIKTELIQTAAMCLRWLEAMGA